MKQIGSYLTDINETSGDFESKIMELPASKVLDKSKHKVIVNSLSSKAL